MAETPSKASPKKAAGTASSAKPAAKRAAKEPAAKPAAAEPKATAAKTAAKTALKVAEPAAPAAPAEAPKKTAAATAAPKKAPATKRQAPVSPTSTGTEAATISDEQRYRMIAEAAYYRAESNQFKSDPVRDWIEAEAAVAAMLNAGK